MSRSIWKGPFIAPYIIKKAKALQKSGRRDPIKIYSRASTIISEFVGMTFAVHNGHKFIPVLVDADKVGRRFGEFAPTRTFHGHAGDKKAKLKR